MKQSNITRILHETSLSPTARYLLAFLFTTDDTTINIDKLVSETGLKRRATIDAIAELRDKNMASVQKTSVGSGCIATCYTFVMCAFLSLRQICHHDKNVVVTNSSSRQKRHHDENVITTKTSSRQKYHHDKFVIMTKTQQRVLPSELVRCFVSVGSARGQVAEISKASAVIDGEVNEGALAQNCNITVTIDVRKHFDSQPVSQSTADAAIAPEIETPQEQQRPESEQVPREAQAIPDALEVREAKFREKLNKDFSSKYSQSMLDAFADYWTEHNPGGKRMRYEMQATFDVARRLGTWARRENSRPRATSRRNLPVGFILQEDDMKPFHGMKDEDFFK